MQKIVTFVLIVLLLCTMPMGVLAADPYEGYSYTTTDEGTLAVAAPQAYLPAAVYGSRDLGVTLSGPEDLLFDKDGNLYICDAKQNAVFVFSPQMQLIKTIDTFQNNEQEDHFSSPYGIYLTEEGNLYVADFCLWL